MAFSLDNAVEALFSVNRAAIFRRQNPGQVIPEKSGSRKSGFRPNNYIIKQPVYHAEWTVTTIFGYYQRHFIDNYLVTAQIAPETRRLCAGNEQLHNLLTAHRESGFRVFESLYPLLLKKDLEIFGVSGCFFWLSPPCFRLVFLSDSIWMTVAVAGAVGGEMQTEVPYFPVGKDMPFSGKVVP